MRRRLWHGMILVVCLSCAAPKTLAEEPWYIDDEKLANDFSAKLIDLAKQGKCMKPEDIRKKLPNDKCKVAVKSPDNRRLTPEEVYQRALQSVFVLGSEEQSSDHPDHWDDGRLATAWVLTEDGVMVTNWHVFDKLRNEVYGVVNSKGEVFPVIDVLGSDKVADIALFRVAGKGFVPLPLAVDEKVGAWVAVLGHPGNQFYTFTQGHISRYTRDTTADGKRERWMSVTAEFAYGASGAPVLNCYGAVVGMAAMTTNIDYPVDEVLEDKPANEKPADTKSADQPKKKPGDEKGDHLPKLRPPDKQPAPDVEGSLVQMIVKMAVPGSTIRKFSTGEELPKK